jgi:peptidoglycan-N-acetylglucosamine deacetylase
MTIFQQFQLQSRRNFTFGAAATSAASLMPASAGAAGGLTSRSISVPSAGGSRYGTKHYPGTLALNEGEIVLTFDDGPLPSTTNRILDALAQHNAKAIFFMIGRNAKANPEIVRRVAQAGHGIANHTMNHPWTMRQRSLANGIQEIQEGEDAIQQALGSPILPFFRFPGFADTPDLLAELGRRNRSIWGADFWGGDWNAQEPGAQQALVMHRMRAAKKGILLLHDIKDQTARMMPGMLAQMRMEGFRLVQAVG